ncbi:MAG: hypothetical protein JO366_12750 [Methylobacteriaceae bacterium]|nr:hypothetical protein [Methylobacteriaceae bacterium]MBV9222010.1 hypothetical protein [Methylobacteriaceae bacterium]MBV9245671.1 hypothetical protein [Methylobacteriaceae bacterium]MBV9635574.1 hypothetical protein [Methylobacteriaceae bacterium]
MPEQLTAEHFLPHVDKVFRVLGGAHALTLVQVDALPLQPNVGQRRPFTLIFRGPPGNVLREGLYTMEVDAGPAFDLYIIPVYTPARDRQDYQAVFN